jgi:hypothetical protein
MAMAANLAGIVHHAVIVRRVVVRVVTIAVLVGGLVEVVKVEEDRKDATRAGQVAAVGDLSKGSPKSNWRN